MSIDIDWNRLTTGPDGLELAETIRDFIHDKFQQVELPRFIRSVQVHSFAFGKECPQVEVKDVSDPWAEFYEDKDEDEDDEDDGEIASRETAGMNDNYQKDAPHLHGEQRSLQHLEGPHKQDATSMPPPNRPQPANIDVSLSSRNLNLHGPHPQPDLFPGAFLSRSSTPGISGGTSNLGYFHLPLSAGLKSGSQTPLAAAFPPAMSTRPGIHRPMDSNVTSSRLPATPLSAPLNGEPSKNVGHFDSPVSSADVDDSRALDIQTTLHITYTGSLSISLTAELLLDYPMPSFMGIPLALRITGLSFEGVALLAYLRAKKRKGNNATNGADTEGGKGRCQFCFLGEEEGKTFVESNIGGGENVDGASVPKNAQASVDENGVGSPLKEIHIETAIGRQSYEESSTNNTRNNGNIIGGNNKPVVLKNVGKVEKFVLEQVRRIFEEEFVWPSFWTVLL